MAEVLDHGAGGGSHPLLDCVREMQESLDKVADVEPVFLTTDQKATVLEGLATIAEREQGLVLRVLGVADDLAVEAGARSAADWLGQRTRTDHTVSAGRRRLADALEQRYRVTQRGVLEGAVSVEQARVIVHALDALPTHIDTEVRERAEAYLVEQAAHFTPKQLRVLGRRVLEVVAPEVAEDH